MSGGNGTSDVAGAGEHPRRVVLCDDHVVFGTGLSAVVRSLFPSAELAHAHSLADLLGSLEGAKADELFLVDFALGDGTIETALQLLAEAACSVLVVSAQESPLVARRILAAGIAGYVAKSAPLEELRSAMVAVASGGRHIPELVLDTEGLPGTDVRVAEQHNRLTARQRQVAELLASGFSNREIRDELGVSENTVKSHLRGIFAALDVSNRTEAAIEWLRIRSQARND